MIKRIASEVGQVTSKWVRARSLWIVILQLTLTYLLMNSGYLIRTWQCVTWCTVCVISDTVWFGGKAWRSLIDQLPEMIVAWRGKFPE